jgi:hypothetical protein
MSYCNDYINKRCSRENCKFLHDDNICSHFWKFNNCKFNDDCKFKHVGNTKPQKKKKHVKNTETFKPINKNDVDMRLIIHDSYYKSKFDEQLTNKDVVLINNLFSDYAPLEIYYNLVKEIETCGIHTDELLKLWHGDSHLIADDKMKWKDNCPTFAMITDRVKEYFNMSIPDNSTRFNWYKDTSQWKPYHKDASAIKPHIAKVQNFTLAISFGATRETSFERDTNDKTKISIPQPDGSCYAFCNKTNELWRHGILQEPEVKQEGRISIICWGWVDGIKNI